MVHSGAMETVWDYRLVGLSVIIAIIGSYIALDFAGRMKSAHGVVRKVWFFAGALAMGLAIWSMHFVGMLALVMPMPVTYNETLSFLSIMAASLGAGIAFAVLNRESIGRIPLITGSTAMGLAIVTMHYLGMASMEMQATTRYDPFLFGLSVLIAITASAGALWLAFRLSSRDNPHLWFYQKVVSALVMGLAIAGMHYTGMAAATYVHSGEVVSGLSSMPTVGDIALSDLLVGASVIFGLALLLLGAQASAERQRFLEALKASEERYELVIAGSNDGIWDWDHTTNTIYWNQRCYDQVGIPYETKITSDLFISLIHPEDREKSLEIIRSHLERDTPYEIEFRLRHSSGEYRYFMARGKSIRDESGRPLRTGGTRTDITARKKLESELEIAKEVAEAANRKKSQFLANMSHELRTPLNAVIGYSQMMERGVAGELNEKQKKYVHNIRISGQHLLDIVNDILDVAKIEAGQIKLEPVQVDVQSLVEDLQAVLKHLAEDKSVELIFEVAPELHTVVADAARLRQIFFNLISNAIKFNKPNGTVIVRLYQTQDTRQGPGWFMAEVEDTGIGMPQDKMGELFTQFYQIDSSTSRQHEGTGLGLAVTKRLVELHGGQISVKSQEGVGSTFTFQLPVKAGVKVEAPVTTF